MRCCHLQNDTLRYDYAAWIITAASALTPALFSGSRPLYNHIHLIWHILHPHTRDEVQRDMMKFTAQTIVRELKNNDPEELAKYYVGAADRKYQVWERNPLSIPLWSEEVVKQKLAYLHDNPVRAGLCKCPEDYKYSSAQIYMGGEDARVYYTIIFLICNLPARVVRSENKTDNGGETSKICIHLVYYCWNFIIYLMLSKNKIIKLRIYFFVF